MYNKGDFSEFLLIHFFPTIIYLFFWLISVITLHFVWDIDIFTKPMILLYIAIFIWYLLAWNIKEEMLISKDHIGRANNMPGYNDLYIDKLRAIDRYRSILNSWSSIRIYNRILPIILILIGLAIAYLIDASNWSSFDTDELRVYSAFWAINLSNIIVSIRYHKLKS